MSYPGGKGAEGAAQAIINQMPPHEIYVELFLGSGYVLRTKKPALVNIGVEIDPDVVEKFTKKMPPEVIVENRCALEWLTECMSKTEREKIDMLIYADPPYMPATLKSRQRYKYKFTEADHHELLRLLKAIKADVIISGFESPLYEKELHLWRKHQFTISGRDHKSHIETLWMNFEKPVKLHDYRFLGNNFRQREAIKRRIQRNARKLASWPITEQYAFIRAYREAFIERENNQKAK